MVILTAVDSLLGAGAVMEIIADTFEEHGLKVPVKEQQHPHQLAKAIGYEIIQSKTMLRLPDKNRIPFFRNAYRNGN